MTKPYCPILPKNLPEGTLEESMPWSAVSGACNDYNTLENMGGTQVMIDNSWNDLINTAGMPIYYYVYKFSMERANKIWGEDVEAQYEEPFEIKAYLEIKDVPKTLGPLGGFFADDSVTAYIHIKTFERLVKDMKLFEELKLRFEPKPQDLIQIIEYGCDRPGLRGANLFEITNKEDQLISQSLNPGYGHFIWKITAKRFQFAQEGGAIEPYGESGNCQEYDSSQEGIVDKLSEVGNVNAPQDKVYNFNIDRESKEKVFNQNVDNQSDIYGGYYE